MAVPIAAGLANVATAGRSGPEVRSDCRITLHPATQGGVAIELQSRVGAYYGEQITAQARQVLAELGVEHARVLIEDSGALPYVIAARIESAVRRAGTGHGRRSLPARISDPPPSPRDRLRRSRLYLPGSEPKYFVNAALYGPDAVIFDLEDSVHPEEKDSARILVRNALRAVELKNCERMVRINQLPPGLADLDEVVPESPDLILIPKVEGAEQIAAVEARIARLRADCRAERPIWLMPILESALGIENAFAVATASPLIAALTIGLEDYTADLGVAKTTEGNESWYARLRLVNAARAAGVQAIDSVYGDVEDMAGLLAWGRRARSLGFRGMGCVHPLQIPVVHEAFAPGEEEIVRALRIVSAFQEARKRGLGVVSLGSKMIDAPVVERAVKLVQQAEQMGLVTERMRAQALAPAAPKPFVSSGGEG